MTSKMFDLINFVEASIPSISNAGNECKNSSLEQGYLNLLQKIPDLVKCVPKHQSASCVGIKPSLLSRLRDRSMGNTQMLF